jgi:hypothetical protein
MDIDETRKKSLRDNMVNIIKEWNTVYHPTEGDYKKLADTIIDYLEKENIINNKDALK